MQSRGQGLSLLLCTRLFRAHFVGFCTGSCIYPSAICCDFYHAGGSCCGGVHAAAIALSRPSMACRCSVHCCPQQTPLSQSVRCAGLCQPDPHSSSHMVFGGCRNAALPVRTLPVCCVKGGTRALPGPHAAASSSSGGALAVLCSGGGFWLCCLFVLKVL